jgi:hypothetical protein
MKKIQRLIMLLCMFSFWGTGQTFGQSPNIICPPDITISCETDYTNTDITGVAEAFDINGTVEVEYTDIIINLDANNDGFVRRRWNVVGMSNIFCDHTIRMECVDLQFECKENVAAALSSGVNGSSSVKVFAESLVDGDTNNNTFQASKDGVFYDDFIKFDCCDIGINTFYVKYQVVNDNGIIEEEVCTGLITIEDKLAPYLSGTQPVYLALFDETSVELTLDMLSNHIFDNCEVTSATFSQSQFNAIGNYDVEYIISDNSGNTSEGTITVIVVSGNSIVCNNNVNVSLDEEGNARITPDMILEGAIPANGDYRISVNGGPFNKTAIMTCSHQGIDNEVVIQEESTGNQCWSTVVIEDKLPPFLNIPSTVYLTLDVPTEALLTTEMLDRYTFENCSIESQTLSQSLFTSVGTYDVNYTVVDGVGNASSQSFQVIVTSGAIALACNNETTVTLDDNDMAIVDYFSTLEGNIYLNTNFTVGIGYYPDFEATDFFESITLDCSHVGENLAIIVKDENTGNLCWGNLIVLDKKAPTPYAQSVISASMNGAEPYVLDPALVDLGSFDNCGGDVSMIVSPNTFYTPGTYSIKLKVFDESGNSDFAVSSLILEQGEGTPLECVGLSTVLTNPFSPTTLWAIDFVLNPEDFESFTMSTNPNGPYTETIDFDCSQYNINEPIEVYVLGLSEGVLSSCTVQLTLLDQIPPVAVAKQNVILNLVNGEATLTPDLLDNGSYDLCGSVTLSLSQTLFTTAHLGENQVFLTVTDESGNFNQTWSYVTVVDGGYSSIECINISTALLDQFGPTTLYASDFVINQDDFDAITMATNPNGPYTETIDFDCINFTINSPFDIYLLGTNNEGSSICATSLTLIDNTPPVAIGEIGVILELVNGQATLTSEMVDDGSYDNCGEVSFSLSQTLFTTDHLGENIVILTVTDESGNSNQVVSTITVVDNNNGNGCTVDNIIFPSDISITDADGELENLSVENLQAYYNYTYEQVYPYTVSLCDNIIYSYVDQTINTALGYKVLRTFTALDWLTTSIKTNTQIINLSMLPNTSLACNDNITVNVENGSVQMFPEDCLEGTNYDYSTMVLAIQFNGNNIPDNIITPNYVGETLTYTVTDTTSGNSCWGTITVISVESDCPIEYEDISFPLPAIYLANADIDPSEYTPQNLVSNYGFEVSEVEVTVNTNCPDAIWGYSYDDTVFNYTDGNYKIVREFTVIDWNTFDPGSTEGIWTFTQTINVGINPNNLICDVLPNSAPIGTCDTGHSLDDDVEWPSDLSITDYRITPDGLIEFSNVEEKDARPIFFNSPNDYTATYLDLLVELTPSTLTIARIWKAVNNQYDLTWHYSQTIVVDFSGFENLVSVNTATDRAVPGVIFNNSFETNMEGEAQVLGDIITINFEDEVLNGINVRDLILIQRHILGLENLDERLTIASDINSNGEITASDIIDLRKRILGVTDQMQWNFIDTQIDNGLFVQPKASYTAYKKGDVDDSAILPGDEELPITAKLTIEDKVLNIGETYLIPIVVEDQDLLFGMEIRLGINTDLIENIDIQNNLDFESYDSYVSEDGEMVIVINEFETALAPSLDANNAVVYIQFTAKTNTLLHSAIDVSNRRSYAVDENLELFVVGGEIENVITDTNSPELASLKVFPNPTSDYLRVDQSGVSVKGNINVSVLNGQGQLIINQSSDIVDVRDLAGGMYYYKITIGEYEKKGKFIVVR